MALQAADGSYNIRINAPGTGLFTPEGYLRIDTLSPGPGLYGPSGAYRGEVSASEAAPPSGGYGVTTTSGGRRLTQTGSANYLTPGLYAKDGSYKVTVNV